MPRVCLEDALPNGVFSFWLHIPNLCPPPMSKPHVHAACSCTGIYLGGSYATGALRAFVRVCRHKTFSMYHLSYCFLLIFVFCLINVFFKFKFQVNQRIPDWWIQFYIRSKMQVVNYKWNIQTKKSGCSVCSQVLTMKNTIVIIRGLQMKTDSMLHLNPEKR